jgi:flagellin-specific chaperone FliS
MEEVNEALGKFIKYNQLYKNRKNEEYRSKLLKWANILYNLGIKVNPQNGKEIKNKIDELNKYEKSYSSNLDESKKRLENIISSKKIDNNYKTKFDNNDNSKSLRELLKNNLLINNEERLNKIERFINNCKEQYDGDKNKITKTIENKLSDKPKVLNIIKDILRKKDII